MTTSTIQQAKQIYHGTNHCDNHQLKIDDNYEWIANPGFHETKLLFGKSFAGTDDVSGEPFCDWAVDHIGDWLFADNKKHYTETMTFGLGFPLYAVKKDENAFILLKQNAKTGDTISAAAILEYDPNKPQEGLGPSLLEGWRNFKAFYVLMHHGQIPELYANKKYKADCNHFEKKIKHAIALTKKWHAAVGPKELHWYVKLVGVSPDFNGQGMGRDLMEKIGELADKVGVACYLECGLSNKGFYEKMGYHVVSSKLVDDPVDSKRDPLDLMLMVRPSKKSEPPEQ